MEKQYLYLTHNGLSFFLSDHLRNGFENYCSQCGSCDILEGICDDEQKLAEKLEELFLEGYDAAPGDGYYEIRRKYCPEEYWVD